MDSSLLITVSSISRYLSPFCFSSSTTDAGAFATKPWLESFLSTRATSPSSLFFSFSSLSRSASKSTRSASGIRSSPPVNTAETTPSGVSLSVPSTVISTTLAIFFMWAESASTVSLSASVLTIRLSLRLGAASTSVLAFLIALMISLAVSILETDSEYVFFSS